MRELGGGAVAVQLGEGFIKFDGKRLLVRGSEHQVVHGGEGLFGGGWPLADALVNEPGGPVGSDARAARRPRGRKLAHELPGNFKLGLGQLA